MATRTWNEEQAQDLAADWRWIVHQASALLRHLPLTVMAVALAMQGALSLLDWIPGGGFGPAVWIARQVVGVLPQAFLVAAFLRVAEESASVSVGPVLHTMLRRLPGLIGQVIAVAVLIGAVAVPGFFMILFADLSPRRGDPAVPIAVGFAALVAALALARWYVAIPILLATTEGPVASLRRSWRLTGDAWVMCLCCIVATDAPGLLIGFGLGPGTAGRAVSILVGFITIPLGAALAVAAYRELVAIAELRDEAARARRRAIHAARPKRRHGIRR